MGSAEDYLFTAQMNNVVRHCGGVADGISNYGSEEELESMEQSLTDLEIQSWLLGTLNRSDLVVVLTELTCSLL